MPENIMETICFLIAFMCGIYGFHRLFLVGIYLWFRRKENPNPPLKDNGEYPRVTIQLPIYNERYVVRRLIEAVCNIEYPRHLLDIQVLDAKVPI